MNNYQQSQIQGSDAEVLFEKIAESRGWNFTPASAHENRVLGYDAVLKQDGEARLVEIKSQKKINRKDAETQNQLVWIELRNISGGKGSLYKMSSHFAFQHDNEFWVIPTLKLQKIVEMLVKNGIKVDSASEALYNFYTRFSRKDCITLIKYSDIEPKVEKWA